MAESFGGVIGSASFQEPHSADTTSAAPEMPPAQQPQQPQKSLAAALAAQKKRKKQRSSEALQRAITRSRSSARK
jgi:hypothetical protein